MSHYNMYGREQRKLTFCNHDYHIRNNFQMTIFTKILKLEGIFKNRISYMCFS